MAQAVLRLVGLETPGVLRRRQSARCALFSRHHARVNFARCLSLPFRTIKGRLRVKLAHVDSLHISECTRRQVLPLAAVASSDVDVEVVTIAHFHVIAALRVVVRVGLLL